MQQTANKPYIYIYIYIYTKGKIKVPKYMRNKFPICERKKSFCTTVKLWAQREPRQPIKSTCPPKPRIHEGQTDIPSELRVRYELDMCIKLRVRYGLDMSIDVESL